MPVITNLGVKHQRRIQWFFVQTPENIVKNWVFRPKISLETPFYKFDSDPHPVRRLD